MMGATNSWKRYTKIAALGFLTLGAGYSVYGLLDEKNNSHLRQDFVVQNAEASYFDDKNLTPVVVTHDPNVESVSRFTTLFPQATIIDSQESLDTYISSLKQSDFTRAKTKEPHFLLYVTGDMAQNQKKDTCVSLRDTCIPASDFQKKFSFIKEHNIEGTYVFDHPHNWLHSHYFIEGGFKGVALSPGNKNHLEDSRVFSSHFWPALQYKIDLNNDGVTTPLEAYVYAMKEYNKENNLKGVQQSDGTYLASLEEITLSNVERIAKEKTPMIIEVGATWCGPCTLQKRELNKLQVATLDSFTAYQITLDKNPDSKYVQEFLFIEEGESIPHLVFRSDGKNQAQHLGLAPFEKLRSLFQEHLER